MRITFTDGSVMNYPAGVSTSENADGTLMFVNDGAGNVIATLTYLDVKSAEKIS